MTWVALRFRQRGVVVGSLVVAAIADAFTANGIGPFVESTPHASLMVSQTFVGITALASLLVAAITSEREQAVATLRRARDTLEAEVRERTAVLARSEASLAEAQQIAGLGTWKWDIRTNKVTWSEALYRIYGVSPDDHEPSYASYLGRVHPDDRAHVEAAISGALANHEPFAYDERILMPDGSVR
jgi:PAS domain-containing protein